MIILDASALIKMVVKEEHSDRVRELIRDAISGGEVIAAPDIAFAESLNGIWRHAALLKDIKRDDVADHLSMLSFVWNRIVQIDSLTIAQNAMDVGIDNGLTIYDALYVAASHSNNAPLLTFDGLVRKKAAKLGIIVL